MEGTAAAIACDDCMLTCQEPKLPAANVLIQVWLSCGLLLGHKKSISVYGLVHNSSCQHEPLPCRGASALPCCCFHHNSLQWAAAQIVASDLDRGGAATADTFPVHDGTAEQAAGAQPCLTGCLNCP